MQQNQDSAILSDLKGERKGKETGEAGKEVKKIFEQVFAEVFLFFSFFLPCYFPLFSLLLTLSHVCLSLPLLIGPTAYCTVDFVQADTFFVNFDWIRKVPL